jgi:hypothetical protein
MKSITALISPFLVELKDRATITRLELWFSTFCFCLTCFLWGDKNRGYPFAWKNINI